MVHEFDYDSCGEYSAIPNVVHAVDEAEAKTLAGERAAAYIAEHPDKFAGWEVRETEAWEVDPIRLVRLIQLEVTILGRTVVHQGERLS